MGSPYLILGKRQVKDEYTAGHCRRLAKWYTPTGKFIHGRNAPDTRERLWSCLSLLAHPNPRYRLLAEQIIKTTPVDHNHFEPFAAAEVLLRFGDKLSAKPKAHLEHIMRAHLANSMEVRMGVTGTNNFSCMATWFLLAAGQALDRYTWDHPLASIPEVYVRERLQAMGLNALHALAHYSEHQAMFQEWNSPSYTTISLHCMAKIVELIDDPEAKKWALEIEMKLWREVLQMFHPDLGMTCGPYSRAYRMDMLGFATQLRVLFAYTGLGKDRSIIGLHDDYQHLRQSPYDPDLTFKWAGLAWILSNHYHVPVDAVTELRHRTFPHRFSAPTSWGSFGHINAAGKWVSVQGNVLPAGTANIVQVQHPNWALGFRSLSTLVGHSFPMHLHYATRSRVRTMRHVRTITAGVYFHNAPDEWLPGPAGEPVEASNFNSEGEVAVTEDGNTLSFTARAFPQFSAIRSTEQSVNTFFPIHFAPLEQISLNGQRFTGEELRLHARTAVCHVRDAGFEYEVEYTFPKAVEIRLYPWGNFLRFAGFYYRGTSRDFTAGELKKLKMRGQMRVLRTP